MFLKIETFILLKLIWRWDDSVIFLENITFWACLFWSGLNDIFHWYAHSDTFCKSLLNSFAEVLGSWKMENNDVSSANSFTMGIMSANSSFHPCGTPTFTGSLSDVWTLTLWNLFIKKHLIRFSNAFEIPID